jgi:hypothetical protein
MFMNRVAQGFPRKDSSRVVVHYDLEFHKTNVNITFRNVELLAKGFVIREKNMV